MDRLALWIAQGFGIGRIPVAPGTFGSLVGIVWMLVLVRTGALWWYLAGTVAGIVISVWLCSRAERILKHKDAPSVVLDEIVALPVCFIGIVTADWMADGALSSPQMYLQPPLLYVTLVVFGLFRIFDIAKVWPAARLERWPGGLGITADDVMAAVYVALVSVFFAF